MNFYLDMLTGILIKKMRFPRDTNAFETQLLEMININNKLESILRTNQLLSTVEKTLFSTFRCMIDQYLSTYVEKNQRW